MNILFINSIGRDKFGGGEKWMINAAKGLAQQGHNVVLGSKKNSRTLRYAASTGVRTEVFDIHSDISPLNTLKIAFYLRRHAVDVIICNLNKDVRVAGLAARLYGKTTVLARHGMQLCANKLKYKITLKKLVDGIITNSYTIKDAYARYGWFDDDFVKVIYNGITIPEDVAAHDFSKSFPGKKIIYSAGRLSEQKGYTFLIDVASNLHKKRSDLVFVVSGEGAMDAELKKQVTDAGLEESFVFTGFNADIYPFLKGCDLFVLSSLFEGMPNVIMEAMAMKKPVVATNVNGVRELMVDGKTGMIVPSKDPEAFCAAIESIIDHPDKLLEFGKSGYERVCEKFTMPAMVESLERHLEQVIGSPVKNGQRSGR